MSQPPEEQERLIPARDVDRRYRVVEQAGWMGKIFGSATTPPIGIAGVIALLFTLANIVVLFVPSNMPASDYLERVLPIGFGRLPLRQKHVRRLSCGPYGQCWQL